MNQHALPKVTIIVVTMIVSLFALVIIGGTAASAEINEATLSINHGDEEAESTEVSLLVEKVTGEDEISQMRIWNDGDDEDAGWEPFEADRLWTLSEDEGTKAVWVQLQDASGDVSVAFSDSIELDTGPTRAQFFMMMFGTLAIVVVVFSVIAFYVITRPNFKAHGADAIDDHESGSDRLGALLDDGKDSDKDSDSSKES